MVIIPAKMSEENEIFFRRKIEFPSDKTRIPFGQNFRLTRIHKKKANPVPMQHIETGWPTI